MSSSENVLNVLNKAWFYLLQKEINIFDRSKIRNEYILQLKQLSQIQTPQSPKEVEKLKRRVRQVHKWRIIMYQTLAIVTFLICISIITFFLVHYIL